MGKNKLSPTLIGKLKNPRAFKKLEDLTVFPCGIHITTKAWINGDIFSHWFKQESVLTIKKYLAETNLSRKAILIRDNVSFHPANEELQNGEIKAVFFLQMLHFCASVWTRSTEQKILLPYPYNFDYIS